jgi:ABC-type Fe3+/spermidine/putrescine transport system ATPase subunit
LITGPEILLLDEPLSALDAESREEMYAQLKDIHRKLNTTTLHVTHDFEEAMSLADNIVVINQGKIAQIGKPSEIFYHPASDFVARFTMARNIFEGKITGQVKNEKIFKTDSIKLYAVSDKSTAQYAVIRAEMVQLTIEKPVSVPNVFRGSVKSIIDKGANILITVDCPPLFECLLPRRQFETISLNIGQQVYLSFPASSVHLI